ncbi:MAG: hypothetical protein HOP35_15135 [Nitrospira sp.]|nr:hypothetical protein [Nitrospira sp.]
MATRMTLCGFCRRLTCEQTDAGHASEGLKTVPLEHDLLRSDDTIFVETYCRDCDRFYQQLITFGRGEASPDYRRSPGSSAQDILRATIAAGSPT